MALAPSREARDHQGIAPGKAARASGESPAILRAVSFERGSVIAGKYRVERLIGQGGMGLVYAARHLGLDELVAVKVIREERSEGADALARFQREARAAARIKSEHVARVLDVDRLATGEPYLVMELIDGTDLHALLHREGALSVSAAVGYIVQACEGVAEAHALGMVHRDLKLKNLFLTKRRDGRALIKVIDFGVVKLSPVAEDITEPATSTELSRTRAREATLTGTAAMIGSVHYMAPEQIRASNIVTAQADVWSLGVCLYALLTGELPFEGATVSEICATIQGRPTPEIRSLAPQVPPELAGAIERALEKDTRRRFTNVAELAAAIAPLGADSAAPTRIRTILESDDRPSSGADPRYPRPAQIAEVDASGGAFATTIADGLLGRVGSTIDATAFGSSTPPAPRKSRKSWWLAGAGIAIAFAVPGAMLRSRWLTTTPPTRSAAVIAPTTETRAEPAPAPKIVEPEVTSPASAAVAPAPPADAPPPAKAPHATKRAVPVASPPPKAEASSAYDRF